MASKAEQRRDALRDEILDIAENRIAEAGIGAIKARDLAQQAGCAVGGIYNVFGDLNDIVIAVNGRTFGRLGQAVAASLDGRQDEKPADQLVIMAYAYLDFAAANPMAWRALFDLKVTSEMDVPDWYRAELERLFGFIAGPVRSRFPDMADEDVALMVRALFSSVHGIVLLGLENRISGVPQDQMKRMISLVLREIIGGCSLKF